VELVHLHGVGILHMRCLGRSLFAGGLGTLLLLNAWGGLAGSRIFEIHGWHERPGELLLGNEWVQFGLLR
jgi:hypothetical protein